MLYKDVCNFNTYRECFEELIKEITTLKLCKICNRIDNEICKKCEIGNIIDEITSSDLVEDECPICYKTLSLRYLHICSDNRHKICTHCYSKLETNNEILCPLCRQNDS